MRGLIWKTVTDKEIFEAQSEGDGLLQQLVDYHKLQGELPDKITNFKDYKTNTKLGEWNYHIRDKINGIACLSIGNYARDGVALEKCTNSIEWYVDS
jgi:hypothetical protein